MSPGLATVPINGTPKQFEDWIVGSYDSGYHPLGTAPMLPKEDGGVVDSELLVYGTRNVRVIGKYLIANLTIQTDGRCAQMHRLFQCK
jgi:choline dehydrogenase-like flavoprotein